jgi:hypothetical protein
MRHACSAGDDDCSEGDLNNPTVPDSDNESVDAVNDEDDPFAKFEKEVSMYFPGKSKFQKCITTLMHAAGIYSFLCPLLKVKRNLHFVPRNYNFLKISTIETVSLPVACHKV